MNVAEVNAVRPLRFVADGDHLAIEQAVVIRLGMLAEAGIDDRPVALQKNGSPVLDDPDLLENAARPPVRRLAHVLMPPGGGGKQGGQQQEYAAD